MYVRPGLSLKNVVFVSDKGYSDAKNINDCLRNKLGFLFNVQMRDARQFCSRTH